LDTLYQKQWNQKREKKKLGILFTFWWNIWKERNHKIFEHKEASVSRLASEIIEAVKNLEVAFPSLISA
jgi:hypothetical protein